MMQRKKKKKKEKKEEEEEEVRILIKEAETEIAAGLLFSFSIVTKHGKSTEKHWGFFPKKNRFLPILECCFDIMDLGLHRKISA